MQAAAGVVGGGGEAGHVEGALKASGLLIDCTVKLGLPSSLGPTFM